MNKKRPFTSSKFFYPLSVLALIGLFGALFNSFKSFLFFAFFFGLFAGVAYFVYRYIFKKESKPVAVEKKKKRMGRKKDAPHLRVIQGGKKSKRKIG